jgi:hypothetical protein
VCLAACTLVLMDACSLHSLEYLGALGAGGDAGTAGGDANTAGGDASSTGGDASATGGDASSTGGDGRAGSGASGGMEVTGGAGTTDPLGAAGAAGSGADLQLCNDLQKNGEETDRDCGGRRCDPCSPGKTCATGTDCQSAVCTNTVCQAPSCTDQVLNGSETDLNCGGSCSPCAPGKQCSVNDDCSSGSCLSGICDPPSCVDGMLSAGCLLVDNTPYSLAPAKAPATCIDNELDSVADGNALRLRFCTSELRQTFWAVRRPDGYFAFRNALSGKCLHVRGASKSSGAIIEQSTCTFGHDQLWKPSVVSSTLMTITSRLTDLSLNIAGDNAIDGQAIVQGQSDNTANTQWRITRRSTASYVTFVPEGQLAYRIQHNAELVTLGPDDQISGQWIVVPGLSDASLVSFQSRNDPGRYLHHALLRLWSDTNDGTDAFKDDATFRYGPPLVGADRLSKSLESSNFPGLYWKNNGTTVAFALFAETLDFRVNSTWRLIAR